MCIALLREGEVEFGIDEFVHHGIDTYIESVAIDGGVAGNELELHLLEYFHVGQRGYSVVYVALPIEVFPLETVVLEEHLWFDGRCLALIHIAQSRTGDAVVIDHSALSLGSDAGIH